MTNKRISKKGKEGNQKDLGAGGEDV